MSYLCIILLQADIALAALTVSEVREKAVDFSVPFMHYTDDILLRKRSSTKDKLLMLSLCSHFTTIFGLQHL